MKIWIRYDSDDKPAAFVLPSNGTSDISAIEGWGDTEEDALLDLSNKLTDFINELDSAIDDIAYKLAKLRKEPK